MLALGENVFKDRSAVLAAVLLSPPQWRCSSREGFGTTGTTGCPGRNRGSSRAGVHEHRTSRGGLGGGIRARGGLAHRVSALVWGSVWAPFYVCLSVAYQNNKLGLK